MKIISVTNFRKNIYKIFEEVINNSEPIQITSKKGNAVLISDIIFVGI